MTTMTYTVCYLGISSGGGCGGSGQESAGCGRADAAGPRKRGGVRERAMRATRLAEIGAVGEAATVRVASVPFPPLAPSLPPLPPPPAHRPKAGPRDGPSLPRRSQQRHHQLRFTIGWWRLVGGPPWTTWFLKSLHIGEKMDATSRVPHSSSSDPHRWNSKWSRDEHEVQCDQPLLIRPNEPRETASRSTLLPSQSQRWPGDAQRRLKVHTEATGSGPERPAPSNSVHRGTSRLWTGGVRRGAQSPPDDAAAHDVRGRAKPNRPSLITRITKASNRFFASPSNVIFLLFTMVVVLLFLTSFLILILYAMIEDEPGGSGKSNSSSGWRQMLLQAFGLGKHLTDRGAIVSQTIRKYDFPDVLDERFRLEYRDTTVRTEEPAAGDAFLLELERPRLLYEGQKNYEKRSLGAQRQIRVPISPEEGRVRRLQKQLFNRALTSLGMAKATAAPQIFIAGNGSMSVMANSESSNLQSGAPQSSDGDPRREYLLTHGSPWYRMIATLLSSRFQKIRMRTQLGSPSAEHASNKGAVAVEEAIDLRQIFSEQLAELHTLMTRLLDTDDPRHSPFDELAWLLLVSDEELPSSALHRLYRKRGSRPAGRPRGSTASASNVAPTHTSSSSHPSVERVADRTAFRSENAPPESPGRLARSAAQVALRAFHMNWSPQDGSDSVGEPFAGDVAGVSEAGNVYYPLRRYHSMPELRVRTPHIPRFRLPLKEEERATIFMSIASFRDVECRPMLRDLAAESAFLDRVYLGIAQQHSRYQDDDCVSQFMRLYATLPLVDRLAPFNIYSGFCFFQDNVRVRYIEPSEAKGPTYGRYMAMLLYRGEDFYFMLDSHNRFVPHWDVRLLTYFLEMKHPKAILSHYPDALGGNSPKKFYKPMVGYLCNAFFLPMFSYLRLEGRYVPTPESKFDMPQPWAAGGFLFSRSSILRDVPFDPFLPHIFDGEEILYSVRAWTHGYDIFSPNRHFVQHMYGRAAAPKYWNEVTKWALYQAHARKRIQFLLKSSFRPELVAFRQKVQRLLSASNDTNQSAIVMADMKSVQCDASPACSGNSLVVPTDTQDSMVLIDVNRYGMGRDRTVEAWYAYAGVNPTTHVVSRNWCQPDKPWLKPP